MNSFIGFDFGNFYSQPVVILNLDPKTLRGGTLLSLCDSSSPDPNGIPSAFFYSSKRNNGQPVCGYAATTLAPRSNVVRYLKRNMRGSVTLDGKTFTYEEMITQTIQHCIREANRQLRAQTQTTCNQIGMSYPASFEARDRELLKSLAEKATLDDGTPVKVVGTITEPAAAALDFLAEHPGAKPETCVMAYDLGAGTFDLSVVEAFPNGKRYADGTPYYYDVRWTDGLPELGGLEFDKVLRDIMIKKLGFTPRGQKADILMQLAEKTKRELTGQDTVYPSIEVNDDMVDMEITIQEFNKAAEPLVMQTIELVKKALNDPHVPRPDLILLTGGSSRMRIVQQLLEREIPQYRGKIVSHRPSQAIACGAARFATEEKDNEFHVGSDRTTRTAGDRTAGDNGISRAIVQRTTRDLGVPFINTSGERYRYIETYIPKGTPLPCTSKEISGFTLNDNQSQVLMDVYEATTAFPNRRKISEDYRKVMDCTFDYRRRVPQHTPNRSRIIIDKDNILHLEAWEPDRRLATLQAWDCTYKPKE